MDKNKEIELKVLKQFIGAIIDDAPGIYPKSIEGGKYSYKKRTDYMNGWNDGVKEYWKLIVDIMHDMGINVYDGDNCIDEPEIIING